MVMEYYATFVNNLDQFLQEQNVIANAFARAEEITQIPRLLLAKGVIGLWALYLILGHSAELICNAIGFGYPAYSSISALESHNRGGVRKWLTYWVTFAGITILEFFSEIILAFIPFYWLLKCIFLIWCFAPIESNGSIFIYNKFILPVFLSNQQAIDGAVNEVMGAAAGLAQQVAANVDG